MIHRTSSALLRSLSHRVVSARHRPGQRAGCSGVLTNTQHSRATRLLPELPYFSSGYHSVSSATQTKPQRNWHCHVPAAASARVSSNVQGKVASGPMLPLSERPVQARVRQDDLLAWHATAVAQAEAVGSAFADADGGPSAQDLQVELNWLLDDAVDAVQPSAGAEWRPCTWRQLQSGLQLHKNHEANSTSMQSVALRADFVTLKELWMKRTRDRVPLQYLNNCCHWRDLILAVGPGALIPRPETEILIDLAQQAVHDRPQLQQGPWLDLGTGSGAIAIGLASFLPQTTQVYAVDKSPAAAAWAQLNVQRLDLANRVQVKTGSWYGPVQDMQGSFAGIISNPPYIPHSQMNDLQAEVGQHEPWLALNGGHGSGLDSLTLICQGAFPMLQPGGFLALETTGGEQAEQVVSLLQQMSMAFEHVRKVKDLAGMDCFVTAFSRSNNQGTHH